MNTLQTFLGGTLLVLFNYVDVTIPSFVPFTKQQESRFQKLSIATSCNDLADGVHYIKPSKDGEVIPVVCDNGYTMINLNLNEDSISTYFTSWYQTHEEENGVFSPDCDIDTSETSWRDWWEPATSETNFRVSPDCTSCESSLSYGDNTAYYMTSYYFCFNKQHDSACAYTKDEVATMDTLSYDVEDREVTMCNVCDDTYRDLSVCKGQWCDCLSLQLDADTQSDPDHDRCVDIGYIVVKPSVTNDGHYCTCYQTPDTETDSKINSKINSKSNNRKTEIFYENDSDLERILPKITKKMAQKYLDAGMHFDGLIRISEEDEDEDEDISDDDSDDDSSDDSNDEREQACAEKVYFLSNDDFLDGTLRIQECGHYILSEDILIHFNKPNENDLRDVDWSPNGYEYENFPWYPTLEQEYEYGTSGNGKGYEGATSFHGSYQFGFWAGITIETSYVTINLNGHKIEMDEIYYLQQRTFTHIQLNNKQFIRDQGPANMGRQKFLRVHHVTIKNGELGRSSHHGIHGTLATDLHIENVKIFNFDVAGIQCNGCKNAKIVNCVVGPQSSDIPVLGKYNHGRSLIPRLQYLVDNYGDEQVTFGSGYKGNSRTTTMKELADEFVEEMDLVYHFIVNGIDWSQTDRKDQWEKAYSLFINPSGYQDGGSSYGIFLNGGGTGVVSFGRRPEGTKNIMLKNVEIKGIHTQPWERFWASGDAGHVKLQGFFFDTLDWKNLIDIDNNYLYTGDAYSDIVFATQHVANDGEYCFFNTLFTTSMDSWVFEDDISMFTINDPKNGFVAHCGSDVQSHDAKGTMGLRVDSVQGLIMDSVYIHDVNNYGDLADDSDHLCGNWDVIDFLRPIFATIEPGYTGTRAHGMLFDLAKIQEINNVLIDGVRSKYGTAIGASIYAGTTLRSMSDVYITNVNAGWALTDDDIDGLATQNRKPRTCLVEIGEDEENYPVVIHNKQIDEKTIIGASIVGFDICEDDQMLGIMYDDLDSVSDDVKQIFQEKRNNWKQDMSSQVDISQKQVSTDHDSGRKKHSNYLIPVGFIVIIVSIFAVLISKVSRKGTLGLMDAKSAKRNTEKSPLISRDGDSNIALTKMESYVML